MMYLFVKLMFGFKIDDLIFGRPLSSFGYVI